MGRSAHLDKTQLKLQICSLLTQQRGLSGADLCHSMGISEASLSRLVRELVAEGTVQTSGGKRNKFYHLVRKLDSVPSHGVPVFEVGANGNPHQLGELIPIAQVDYLFRHSGQSAKETVFDGCPHFLMNLIPSGYLGRSIAGKHTDLNLPQDPRLWSPDIALKYLTHHGADGIGSLIVGSRALETWMHERLKGSNALLREKDREQAFPVLAQGSAIGHAGSSAGGDQPKFLCSVVEERSGEVKSCLVKFSPPVTEKVGRRIADLLISEHLALETMRENAMPSAESELITISDRIFLQVTRFDRNNSGRHGVVSLAALDAHYTGHMGSWSEISTELSRHKVIPSSCLPEVFKKQLFGHLIANTDMHSGNLSFFCSGLCNVSGLAPTYDMTPMHYIPRSGEVTWPPFLLPRLEASLLSHFQEIASVALEFWKKVSTDARISEDFRSEASKNRQVILSSISNYTRLGN